MQSFVPALLGSLMIACQTALATITVAVVGSGSTSATSPSSGAAFTLTASGTVLFKVFSDGSSDEIGRITLTGTGTVQLLVGKSGSFPTSQDSPFTSSPLAGDWDGLALSSFSGAVTVAGKIGHDLTQSVTADHIFRLEVDNDIEDAVTATGVDDATYSPSTIGPVIAGRSITSTASVVASATPGVGETVTIKQVATGQVTTTSAVFAGPISAAHGRIISIAAGGPISISSGGITAGGGIDGISAWTSGSGGGTYHDISADIDADSDNDGAGAIYSFNCQNYTGTLKAGTLSDDSSDIGVAVDVRGDFDGSLVTAGTAFAGIDVHGTFESGSSVEIGGNLIHRLVCYSGDIPQLIVHGDIVDYGSMNSDILFISASGSIGSIQVDGSIAPYDQLNVTANGFGDITVGGDLLASFQSTDVDAPATEFTNISAGGSAFLTVYATGGTSGRALGK